MNGAKDGGGVIKMVMNYLLDMVEKLDKVEKAKQVPAIPTDAPDPPRVTEWLGGEEVFKCHTCPRSHPREGFSETQSKSGVKASRKYETCCRNAACGVVLAKTCVGCGGVKSRAHFSGTLWGKKGSKCGDCATGPQSLARAGNRSFKETQPCSARMEPRPWNATMDDRSQPRGGEHVGSGDGKGLPRNTAEL